MDDKERSLIVALYKKIAGPDFDERDVFAFLILLRPHSKMHTPVYEFANFIAHREKDRGHIRDYLHETKTKLANLGKVSSILVIKPVFSVAEIGDSLNEVLGKIQLGALTGKQVQVIVLCIISLLQHVRIVEKSGEVGRLVFGITKSDVILLGRVSIKDKVWAVFPALMVPNDYVTDAPPDTPIIPDNLIAVGVKAGAVSIENV
jgi:hypothetical protein